MDFVTVFLRSGRPGAGRKQPTDHRSDPRLSQDQHGRGSSCLFAAACNYAPARARREQSDFQTRPCWHRTRSEEHTSELQSLMRISYARLCLKKKETFYI